MAGGLSASVWAGGWSQSLRFLCPPLSGEHIALSLWPRQLLEDLFFSSTLPFWPPGTAPDFYLPPTVTLPPLAT